MSKHDDSELPSLDSADLTAVTGGAHRAGHVDAQLTAALTGITNSLKGLQNQNGGSSNSLSQLLPFMMLAKGRAGGCPGGNCGR